MFDGDFSIDIDSASGDFILKMVYKPVYPIKYIQFSMSLAPLSVSLE